MKVLLHAGTHKTGTTTIQHFLHLNRAKLKKEGVYYYEEYGRDSELRKNHHQLAVSIALSRKQKIADAFSRLRSEGKDKRYSIISSESFYRDISGAVGWDVLHEKHAFQLKDLYLSDLANNFASQGIEVFPVIYFRPVEEFAESLFKTLVVGGHIAWDFDVYIDKARYLFNYSEHMRLWSRHFPKARFYKYRKVSLLEGFLSDIGVEYSTDFKSVNDKNVSPDPRVILWLLDKINTEKLDKRHIKSMRPFLFSNRLYEIFSEFESVSLWGKEREKDDFIDRYSTPYLSGVSKSEHRGHAVIDDNILSLLDAEYSRYCRGLV